MLIDDIVKKNTVTLAQQLFNVTEESSWQWELTKSLQRTLETAKSNPTFHKILMNYAKDEHRKMEDYYVNEYNVFRTYGHDTYNLIPKWLRRIGLNKLAKVIQDNG